MRAKIYFLVTGFLAFTLSSLAQLNFFVDTVYFKNEIIKKVSVAPDFNVYCIKGNANREIGKVSKGISSDISSYFTSATGSVFTTLQGLSQNELFVGTQDDYAFKLDSVSNIIKIDSTYGLPGKNINSSLGSNDPSTGSDNIIIGSDSYGMYFSRNKLNFEEFLKVGLENSIQINYGDINLINFSIKRSYYSGDINNVTYAQNTSNLIRMDSLNGIRDSFPNTVAVNFIKFEPFLYNFQYARFYWGDQNGLRKRMFVSPRPKTFQLLSGFPVHKVLLIPLKKEGYIPDQRYVIAGTDSGFYVGKAFYRNFVSLDTTDTILKVKIGDFTKVYDIAVDESNCGNLWLATDKGLYKIKTDYQKDFLLNNITPGDTINTCDKPITMKTINSVTGIQWQKDQVDIPNELLNQYVTSVAGRYRYRLVDPLVTTCYSKEVALVRDTSINIKFPNRDVYRICEGNSISLSVTGEALYAYEWYKNNISTSKHDSVFTTKQDGNYKVKATNCYAMSIFSKDTSVVKVSKIPIPIIKSSDYFFCDKDSVKISTTATGILNWYQDGVFKSQFKNQDKIISKTGGVFRLNVSDSIGCNKNSNSLTIKKINYATTTIDPSSPTLICEGKSKDIKVITNGNHLLWSTGATNNVITVSTPGVYVVKTWLDSDDCFSYDSLVASISLNPKVSLGSDTSHCFGTKLPFQLKAPAGFTSYFWNGTEGSLNEYLVNDPEEVRLKVIDNKGCIGQDTIKIEDNCQNLIIPNIFTPNGDGFNDNFYIQNLLPDCEFAVYNRWGSEIYRTNNYKNNWTAEGVTTGLYYFYLIDKFYDKKYKGWVQIER